MTVVDSRPIRYLTYTRPYVSKYATQAEHDLRNHRRLVKVVNIHVSLLPDAHREAVVLKSTQR